MRCPTLKDLPLPPKGKRGWPWTEESLELPDVVSDGKPWPKISIITPNYNYGRFIEETIRSILLQGYPNMEYIIIDGGSTDDSIKIIKKYEKWLTYWASGKDNGQSQAINRGFSRASGELFAWLNSDDTYEKDALGRLAREFVRYPDADVVSGRCRMWYGRPDDSIYQSSTLRTYEDFLRIYDWWVTMTFMIQPETFFRKGAYESCGGLAESMQFSMDFDLWVRMARGGNKFHSFGEHLANFRMHKAQKGYDTYRTLSLNCKICWGYLMQDWSMFGEKAVLIADNIFRATELMNAYYYKISNSTSYRFGRFITGHALGPANIIKRLLRKSK